MQYFSTRDTHNKVSASEAILQGLASDGGLFVPEALPRLTSCDLASLLPQDYRARAESILSLFLDDYSAEEIEGFVSAAYGERFDDRAVAPLHILDSNTAVLELWHGPTAAFKDMALQILPRLLTAALQKCGETREACILVATSGDTGKAALEGFRDVPGTRILVFYPRDGVSDIQKLQMVTQEGDNVLVCAVEGNFDDAQTGVKRIFSDRALAAELSEKGYFLSSANSINLGRLLPQIAYYFSAYCDWLNAGRVKLGEEINFCVPTGNFGNILAGWYAKEMGLPVHRFLCASNENNVLTDFIRTGVYDKNRAFKATISPSMDILVSSNLERLLFAFGRSDEAVKGYMKSLAETGRYEVSDAMKTALKEVFCADFCDDSATKAQIKKIFDGYGYLMDPHTAVASRMLDQYRAQGGEVRPCVVVSTASPYKFAADVLDALGEGQIRIQNAECGNERALEALHRATGTAIPAPLANVMGREVRFEGSVMPDEMRGVVEGFLI
ncbi:MAG: threonine synthase [Firmicutes bacterium]|nr:threonine synthase [Bacillota bacterium]